MLKNISLKALSRDESSEKLRAVRDAGFLPIVIYGQGKKAQSLKIKNNDFVKVYNVAGESSLINLEIDGKDAIKAIIKSVQKDSLKSSFVHADIYKVDMKEKIEIEIPLNFIGEAKAEKELGGTLSKSFHSVTGSCLPADLVEHIDVDLSKLNTFSDSIKVKDLVLPVGIELLIDKNESIAHVSPPKAVEEEAPINVPVSEEVKKDEKDEVEKPEEKKK